MSAARLREAAVALRAHDKKTNPFEHAVADWLDAEAEYFERMAGGMQTRRITLGYQTIEQALAVADAILGAQS